MVDRDKSGLSGRSLIIWECAEVEGSAGLNVLGGEIGVKGSLSVGVGAHADIGYQDGVIKVDVGASMGVGASVGAELDVGGMVDTICDKVAAAW